MKRIQGFFIGVSGATRQQPRYLAAGPSGAVTALPALNRSHVNVP